MLKLVNFLTMSTKPGQARLSQSGRWVGGGWWVRNTRNKAQLRPAGAGALPELGNMDAPTPLIKKLKCWIWSFRFSALITAPFGHFTLFGKFLVWMASLRLICTFNFSYFNSLNICSSIFQLSDQQNNRVARWMNNNKMLWDLNFFLYKD